MSSSDSHHHLTDNDGHNFPEINEDDYFKMLNIFNEITSVINKTQDFHETLLFILEKVQYLTGMDNCGIYFLDKNSGDYILIKHTHISEEFKKKHGRITKDWSSLHQVIFNGKVVAVSNTLDLIPGADPERKRLVIEEGFVSYVSIPLINENSIVGILMAGSAHKHEFSEIQLEFYSIIGKQIGCLLKIADLMKQLNQSKMMYYDLFNNAADMIYIHDLAGNFCSVNYATVELLGYSQEYILKSNIRDFMTEESLELARFIQHMLSKGKYNFPPPVFELITKDGKRKFLEFNIRPVFENGKIVGIHGITRDVDKRLKAEQNLLIFPRAINHSTDGIDISDTDHKISFINKTGAEIFGYSTRELIGQSVNILYAEEDHSNLNENVIPSMEKYGYWNGLILGRKKDGRTIPVEVNLSSVRDLDGKPLANIGVFRKKESYKKYHMS